MTYPTPEEVEQASQYQLGKWLRFLSSPGMSAIDKGITGEPQEECRVREAAVMDRIRERFRGWNAKISKEIGWDPPKE